MLTNSKQILIIIIIFIYQICCQTATQLQLHNQQAITQDSTDTIERKAGKHNQT